MSKITPSLWRTIVDSFLAYYLWPSLTLLVSSGFGYLGLTIGKNWFIFSFVFLSSLFTIMALFVIRATHAFHQSIASARNKIKLMAYPPLIYPEKGNVFIVPQVKVINSGEVPIEVDSSKTDWTIDGNTGIENKDKIKKGLVFSGDWLWLSGPKFLISPPKEDLNQVKVDVNIYFRYGKPNDLKFTMKAEYQLLYVFGARYQSDTGGLYPIKIERLA